jgi:hypothetical protein
VARKLAVDGAEVAAPGGGEAAAGAGMSEAERKKAALRAALAAGTYEDDGDVCINCSA